MVTTNGFPTKKAVPIKSFYLLGEKGRYRVLGYLIEFIICPFLKGKIF